MKKIISITLILFITLFPTISSANKIITISKGTEAPFNGHLITSQALLKIKNAKTLIEKQCELDLRYMKKNHAIELKFQGELWKKKYELLELKLKKMLEVKDDEISRLQKLSLKTNNKNLIPLWVTLGFLGGAAITLGLVFAVKEAVK